MSGTGKYGLGKPFKNHHCQRSIRKKTFNGNGQGVAKPLKNHRWQWCPGKNITITSFEKNDHHRSLEPCQQPEVSRASLFILVVSCKKYQLVFSSKSKVTFSSNPTTTKCSSMLAFACATASGSPQHGFVKSFYQINVFIVYSFSY